MSNVLVLGATPNSSRYAYKAVEELLKHMYTVIPFGVKKGDVCGLTIKNEWENFQDIDTITLYVNAENQKQYMKNIIALSPRRIIFNPGTENAEFYQLLNDTNIEYLEACTLVMLATGQF